MTRNADRNLRRSSVAAVAIALSSIAGCTSETTPVTYASTERPTVVTPPSSPVPESPASNTDPCALRLHDLTGALLLYYFTYQRLPPSLDEANAAPGADAPVPLTCPASGLPYVYTVDGIQLPERHERVIVYDPMPAHYGGMRWAISLQDARDGAPMIAKVIALPESFFLFRPPTGSPTSRPAD